MSEHPDAQDKLYIRGLLAEADIEETPELVEQLHALRRQSRVPAPEPVGELAALFAGNPVPLRTRSPRGRGIILGAALIGAMAVGAGGVAANPDFLVRADPTPEVTFAPDAPTLERAGPASPETATEPVAPAAVPVPGPAPIGEVVPAPAPAPEGAPEPEPEPEPAPDPEPAIAPAPGEDQDSPPLPDSGSGNRNGADQPRGHGRHGGSNAGGRGQDSAHTGADVPGDRGSSRQDFGRGNGGVHGGTNSHGRGPSHQDR